MNYHKEDIYILNVIRTLCIIWIVVMWHGNDYLPERMHWDFLLPAFEIVTKIVLMVFAFLSGVLLSKYNFSSLGETIYFYRKRFTRFYILFFIASLLFYAHGWMTWKMLIKCLSGVSIYMHGTPYTLWYMSMLMSFYLLTPLIAWKFRYTWINVIIGILISLLMVFFSKNAALFFVCYFIGLHIGQKIINQVKNINFQPSMSTRFVVDRIAYASFCMYLFHRIFYNLVGVIFGYADCSRIVFVMPIYANIIAIIIIVISSYYIQKSYDLLINVVSPKKE